MIESCYSEQHHHKTESQKEPDFLNSDRVLFINELTLEMARLEKMISANVMSLDAIVVRPCDNHRPGNVASLDRQRMII